MTLTLIPFIVIPLMAGMPRFLAGAWHNGGQNSPHHGVANSLDPTDGQDSTRATIMGMFGSDTLSRRQSALIAHAVLACLTWAFLVPIGAIVLRLNIKSAWMLRLHVSVQLISFSMYVAAAGLGIYLIHSLDVFSSWMWNDVHPRLGLAILGLVTVQPFLGFIHHKKFKGKLIGQPNGVHAKKIPGRTVWGRAHLWLGRILIILGVINGGLGIRLAASHPQLYPSATSNYLVGYIIGATVAVFIYFLIIMLFEWKRGRNRRPATRTRAEGG